MARISTYTIDGSIDGTEFVLGREADGTTKQFSMSALQTFLATSISPTTVFANIDVNGGAIDGTPIGASSANTGAFTTLTASSTAAITSNTTIGGTLGVTGLTTMVNAAITGTLSFDGAEGALKTFLGGNGSGNTPTFDQVELNDLSDVLIADSSIYIGHDPTSTDSTASFNVAVGVTALNAIIEGDQNIAIGHDALGAVEDASQIVGIGYEAGSAIVDGTAQAVLVGYQAGKAQTTGLRNTAIGYKTLLTNTTGSSNTAVAVSYTHLTLPTKA